MEHPESAHSGEQAREDRVLLVAAELLRVLFERCLTPKERRRLIRDDEERISIRNVTHSERTAKSNGKKTAQFTFTVTLSAAYDQVVTMSFRTANGTATTGDGDYLARTGTLTFLRGETTETITIEVRGTARRSPTSGSAWTCSATAATRCTPTRGIGTILNDD